MDEKIEKKMFVPYKYAPVSGFFSSDAALCIPETMIDFLRDRQEYLRVACWDGSELCLLNPDTVDLDRGVVRVDAKTGGVCTVVLEGFVNDLPVVTHWSGSLNNGRGGFCPGASDGIGKLDIDLGNGAVINEKPIYDRELSSPYTFLTGKYMLFSGSGEAGSFKVPAYERYIGENFSLSKVTDLLAVWLSNKTLENTGYPVLFKNHPGGELLENVPAFQVVSNYILADDQGNPSLATFLLPPHWKARDKKAYPMVFSGFYDGNENMFQTVGPSLLKLIGNVKRDTGEGVLGVIWNGGGSVGSRTLQHSAYPNLSRLFDIASGEFGGDPGSIVAVGGSRGGIAALVAASNPWHDNYRVKYAVCYNPIVGFGEKEREVPNPTCPLAYSAISEDTGYKAAWLRNWRDPEGGLSGEALFLRNLFGTSDRTLVGEALCPGSELFVKSLKEKGTKVFLAAGTHDAFTTKDTLIAFAERLRKHGVQVHLQFGYRFGHNNATNLYEIAEGFLKDIIGGKEKELCGISHYKRRSREPEEWEKAERFFPERQPVFFEGPKNAALGDKAIINIVGEAGMAFQLKLYKIEDQAWKDQKQVVIQDDERILYEGVLEKKTRYLEGSISYHKELLHFDSTYTTGYYLYEFRILRETDPDWMEVSRENVPQPGVERYPVLELLSHYPAVSGNEMAAMQDVKAIGWGLSEV